MTPIEILAHRVIALEGRLRAADVRDDDKARAAIFATRPDIGAELRGALSGLPPARLAVVLAGVPRGAPTEQATRDRKAAALAKAGANLTDRQHAIVDGIRGGAGDGTMRRGSSPTTATRHVDGSVELNFFDPEVARQRVAERQAERGKR
jgi:hypothetical protein